MAGFGRRQSAPTPSPSAPTSAAASSGEPLALSYPALGGGMVVSAALSLLAAPLLLKTMATSPEVAGPRHLEVLSGMIWWSALAMGLGGGAVHCLIAHRVARFFGKSDFWVFALVGFAFVPFLFFSVDHQPGDVRPPLLMDLILIVKGPLTTGAYWLIAKSRAA